MKLNLEKCTFGIPSGRSLGYIIFLQSIEANLTKIKVVLDMGPHIHDMKDTQKLIGCLVALSHLISKLGEQELPLYKLLRKSKSYDGIRKLKTLLITLRDSSPSLLS